MSLFGTRTGFFYPRLTYTPPGGGETVIDLGDPCQRVDVRPMKIGGMNRSEGGVTEAILIRTDVAAVLRFELLSTAEVAALYTLWDLMWGRQFAVTLDRFATTGDLWQAAFNTSFTKAELLGMDEFTPQQTQLTRPLYGLAIAIRQGA